eukprot:jgi/Ulvmu1/2592/UM014_0043.1
MAALERAAPAPPEAQGQAQQGGIGQIISMVARAALMYGFMMWMRSGTSGETSSIPLVGIDPGGKHMVIPYFRREQSLDMKVSLNYRHGPHRTLWEVPNVPLAGKDYVLQNSINLTAADFAQVVQNNETAVIVTEFTVPERARDAPGNPTKFTYSIPLIKFHPPRKAQEGRSLLGGEDGATPDAATALEQSSSVSLDSALDRDGVSATEVQDTLWTPYFKPNLTIAMVNFFESQNANSLAPNMAAALKVTQDDKYLPLIHLNDFWVLKDHMIPVNETTESLELHLELSTASHMYWMLISTFDIAMETNRKNGMGGEMEELKRVFLEGNPYLLFLTFVVSLLHSVFDMLAFKNDIGFWRSNKSMEGLSAKTVIINAFCQAVIFLYLLDNETSMVVLLSAGIGVLIEFWKITRVMNVSVEATPGQMPRLKFEHRTSYVDSDTKKHDDEATRYMSYVLFPLIVGYFIYSLVYDKHKSWYSFVLQSLVGCVYAFGFVLMCPQLYLNYKLKSVAHLPWRQMTYKFLNTIVDDLGAFIIKMPLLHRLAVFRDDVIFLIMLYQRWIYRVDKNRVNEFGYTGDVGQKPEEVEGTPTPAIQDAAAGTSTATDATAAAIQRRGTPEEAPASDQNTQDESAKDK